MVYVSVRHKVADFAKWKKVFDEFFPNRKAAGELSFVVYRDRKDPNDVTVWAEWGSIEALEKHFSNPAPREAMERAGVLGQPIITYYDRALAA